jgi:hypothetical protein
MPFINKLTSDPSVNVVTFVRKFVFSNLAVVGDTYTANFVCTASALSLPCSISVCFASSGNGLFFQKHQLMES